MIINDSTVLIQLRCVECMECRGMLAVILVSDYYFFAQLKATKDLSLMPHNHRCNQKSVCVMEYFWLITAISFHHRHRDHCHLSSSSAQRSLPSLFIIGTEITAISPPSLHHRHRACTRPPGPELFIASKHRHATLYLMCSVMGKYSFSFEPFMSLDFIDVSNKSLSLYMWSQQLLGSSLHGSGVK